MNPGRIKFTLLPVVSMALIPQSALAQALNEPNFLDRIVTDFGSITGGWHAIIIPIATKVFFTLVLIDWVLSFGALATQGADLAEFMTVLIKRIIFVSFGYWLLSNPTYISDLVTGFRDVGAAVGGEQLHPSNVMDRGLKIIAIIWDKMAFYRPGTSLGYALAGFIILISFALITAALILALVESLIVINGAVIVLGFFGSSFTKDYAMKYLGYCVSVGMKLLVIQLLMIVGTTLITRWADDLEGSDSSIFSMVAASVILLALVQGLPALVQSFISGVSGSGGIGSMMRAAGTTAATAGAAYAGAKTAGASAMSVKEAASLAGTQGHQGMRRIGATVGNLASAAMGDMAGRMSGATPPYGTMAGRMAGSMRATRMGSAENLTAGAENTAPGASTGSIIPATDTPSTPSSNPAHNPNTGEAITTNVTNTTSGDQGTQATGQPGRLDDHRPVSEHERYISAIPSEQPSASTRSHTPRDAKEKSSDDIKRMQNTRAKLARQKKQGTTNRSKTNVSVERAQSAPRNPKHER